MEIAMAFFGISAEATPFGPWTLPPYKSSIRATRLRTVAISFRPWLISQRLLLPMERYLSEPRTASLCMDYSRLCRWSGAAGSMQACAWVQPGLIWCDGQTTAYSMAKLISRTMGGTQPDSRYPEV